MTVLMIVETALLVIAVVYIVALLRSHAEILRRLAALEDGAGAAARQPSAPPRTGGEVVTAGAISGTNLAGDSVLLSFGAGSPVTLLAFLTSGCESCAPMWAGLREAEPTATLADRVVVVTHDPSRESPSRLGRLAPSGVEVIMATAAWEDYAVPASPHFVLTDGSGGVLGRGSALSWSQLVTMVQDARADAGTVEGVRTTAERAARSERTLAESGIGPGHPSLYHPRGAIAGSEQDR
jgi:hypothetical protein